MAIRTKDCTKEYLTSVALPNHAESYTVISHEFIINHTMEQLALHGFTVEKETYRSNSDGSIAQGIYYINYDKDPEIGLMFAWSNSYNKLMRFKCAMGGYVFICMNGVVAGDMGSYGRKHLGTADTETIKAIIEQISNADIYFDRIVADKDTMKKITITERKQAELLGILYAEYELLTNEQISIVKQQMDKPSYDYNCEINSLWAFYNHVTYALKKSHPRDWMDDQRKFHWFVAFEFDLANFVEDAELVPIDQLELNYGEPENQLNILTEIEKAEVMANLEADQIDEDIRYAANEDDVVAELYGVDNDIEVSIPCPCAAHDAETEREIGQENSTDIFPQDEIVEYTDPAGDTFELPMIKESQIPQEIMDALMNAPEMDVSKVDMSKVTWVDDSDTVQYTDPAGNTFEAPVVEIEPEFELPSFDEIVFQGLKDMDESLAEKKALEEALEVEAVKAAEAEELIQLQEKLDKREIKVIAKNILDDDDFNFDLDFDNTDKDDTLGGEFFL